MRGRHRKGPTIEEWEDLSSPTGYEKNSFELDMEIAEDLMDWHWYEDMQRETIRICREIRDEEDKEEFQKRWLSG